MKPGNVEYTISSALAKHIIKTHKGPKKNQQDILCKYVNEQCGLMYNCTKVHIDVEKVG